MNKHSRNVAAAIVLAAALPVSNLAQGQSAAPVPLKPSIALTPSEYARVKTYADQGADELRRFLWRTRMIYNFRFDDLIGRDY
jgi:hypothetical protein